MSVQSPTNIDSYISRNPGKGNGRPMLTPSGVSVRRVVELTREGMSPEEIVEDLRHLSMAEVYSALAYYWANQEDVDEDIRKEHEFFDAMVAEQTTGSGARKEHRGK